LHRFVKSGLVCLGILGVSAGAAAQETVGKRFFSDTLVISEPFVEDELSLPSVLHIRRPARDTEPRSLLTEIGGEIKKRLTPRLELSVAGALSHVDPDGTASLTRIENLALGLKYQYFASEAHEAVLSAALGWGVGGTGQKVSGAESFGVVNPALLFGKGLGDLPEDYAWLRPIAISGVLGALVPTRESTRRVRSEAGEAELPPKRHPNLLQWGLVVEYSLPSLQAHVREVNLPPVINRIFPLVELDLQTAVDRGGRGNTTGTVNPGLVWAGENVQVGIEAVFPINGRTGKTAGVRAFFRVDLDQVLPGLGRPLFGAQP
jgi:hypothetical protein